MPSPSPNTVLSTRLTGQRLGQREQGGVVGHVARGEEQRARLLVQVGQLALQLLVEQRVAGDVAGPAGAGTVVLQRLAAKGAGAELRTVLVNQC